MRSLDVSVPPAERFIEGEARKMKLLDHTDVLRAVARSYGNWCMLLSFSETSEEVVKAAPYLDFARDMHSILDGNCIIVFDSEQECRDAYGATVGDDGPTKTNPYDGPVRVYACTCDPNGELRSENT